MKLKDISKSNLWLIIIAICVFAIVIIGDMALDNLVEDDSFEDYLEWASKSEKQSIVLVVEDYVVYWDVADDDHIVWKRQKTWSGADIPIYRYNGNYNFQTSDKFKEDISNSGRILGYKIVMSLNEPCPTIYKYQEWKENK